jgi:hypothetical protein
MATAIKRTMVSFGTESPCLPGFSTVLGSAGLTLVTRHLFTPGTPVHLAVWLDGGVPVQLEGIVSASLPAPEGGEEPGRMAVELLGDPPPVYLFAVASAAPPVGPILEARQREFPRYEVQLLSGYDGAEGAPRLGEVVSLGEGGCMVLTGPRTEATGRAISLCIELPEPVRRRGVIVWAKSPRYGGRGQVLEPGRMGVRFSDAMVRARLAELDRLLLSYLGEPTIPEPRERPPERERDTVRGDAQES